MDKDRNNCSGLVSRGINSTSIKMGNGVGTGRVGTMGDKGSGPAPKPMPAKRVDEASRMGGKASANRNRRGEIDRHT